MDPRVRHGRIETVTKRSSSLARRSHPPISLAGGGSGGNVPIQVGALLWYDASDASTRFQADTTTPANSDGDPIGKWLNKGLSGAAGDLTLATSRANPVLKLGIRNSLPVIRFDGTSTGLTTSSVAFGTGGRSVYAVVARTWQTLTSYASLVCAATSSGTVGTQFLATGSAAGDWNTGYFGLNANGSNSGRGPRVYGPYGAVPGTGALANGSFRVLGAVVGPTRTALSIDGKSLQTISVATTQPALTDVYKVGYTPNTDRDFWDGDIAELIVFDQELTVGQEAVLLAYLRAKWDTPPWYGVNLWLSRGRGFYQDAAMTTPAVADGDVLGAWQSRVVAGDSPSQGTAISKPLLKLAQLNGYPSMRADGVNDYLTGANLTGTMKTLHMVARKVTAPPAADRFLISVQAGAAGTGWVTHDTTSGWMYYVNSALSVVGLGGDPTAWTILTVRWTDATHATIWRNGVNPVSFTPLASFATGALYNLFDNINNGGNPQNGDFEVAEMLWFDQYAQTDAELAVIWADQSAAFNLALA